MNLACHILQLVVILTCDIMKQEVCLKPGPVYITLNALIGTVGLAVVTNS